MFDTEKHKKLVKMYSIPSTQEIILSDHKGLPPMKCWYCHHHPCVCKK